MLIHRGGEIIGKMLAVFALYLDDRVTTKVAAREYLGRGVLCHERFARCQEIVRCRPLSAGCLLRVCHRVLLLARLRGRAVLRTTGRRRVIGEAQKEVSTDS